MRKKILFLFAIVFISSCSIFETLSNLSYVKFKLNGISDFKVLGISVSDKQNIGDFDFAEIAKLTSAITLDKLPVSFTVNIIAKNDNPKAYETTDIQITDFPFTLYYSGKDLLHGNITRPIIIPGKNKTKIFSVEVGADILKVFDNLSLEEIANIIFDIGGKNQDLSNIQIEATPEILLPGGFAYKQSVTFDAESFK